MKIEVIATATIDTVLDREELAQVVEQEMRYLAEANGADITDLVVKIDDEAEVTA